MSLKIVKYIHVFFVFYEMPPYVALIWVFTICRSTHLTVSRMKRIIKFIYTVELRWLELVGTVGASSTHPCVRAIPSLTNFKLVHMYFMSSRTPRFFSTKVAKRTGHLSSINNPLYASVKMISRMC